MVNCAEFFPLFLRIEKSKLIGIALLILLECPFSLRAQEIEIHGRFEMDSAQIGKPIFFSLTARYPAKKNLLFPDSTYSFSPFEWSGKKYTVTQTLNGISYDSVTYILNTYEIDSVQFLKLPVFVVEAKDCTQIFSRTDTLFLKRSVTFVPDSLSIDKLPLKANTTYLPVGWQLNYLIGGIVAVLLTATGVLVWILFGKKIRRYFALKRLTKNYKGFLEKYDHSVDRLSANFSPSAAEATLVLWKKYLESLKARPYTKFTSKEIREIEQNEALGTALSSIDRMIYGNIRDSATPFYHLKDYVYQQFEKKKTELMHG